MNNLDDERYGIQAHTELFRNLIVQATEYPVYVGEDAWVRV